MKTGELLGKPCKVNLYGTEYTVQLQVAGTYDNGRIAIQAIDTSDRSPFGMVSVNIPNAPVNEGEFCLKDYSENEGWARAAVDACGLFEDTGRSGASGHVVVPIYRLKS